MTIDAKNVSIFPMIKSKETHQAENSVIFEQALSELEDICLKVRDCSFARDKFDIEGIAWQRRFKNIITPVSIALDEYKGPRRFHFHYKHRADDETILSPVEPDAGSVLTNACKTALKRCQNELVGISEAHIAKKARALERALAGFIETSRTESPAAISA